MASAGLAVEVVDLHKSFVIPRARDRSSGRVRLLAPAGGKTLHVIDGIGFEVRRGEHFGIVGRNGSGKTTLLRLIAGIYEPDRGRVDVHGALGPVLQLGVGFSQDLSVRDNAIINAVMLGLTRREARARVDRILEFAELGSFAGATLRNLSPGMRGRLAFATMLETDPDVLLLDEITTAGDQAFQDRFTEAMESFQRRGKTIMLVSHSMPAIEQNCDRAMLVEGGAIAAIGDPEEVAARYFQVNVEADEGAPDAAKVQRHVRITSLLLGEQERGRAGVEPGEELEIYAELEVARHVRAPAAVVEVRTARDVRVFTSSPMPLLDDAGVLRRGAHRRAKLRIENRLVPGQYIANVWIVREGRGGRVVRGSEPAPLGFVVAGPRSRGAGLVEVDASASLDLAAERTPA